MKVDRIHQAIYRIVAPFGEGGTVFLYLLKGDSLALVDTGAADSPTRAIEPAMAEIGLHLSDVDLILNTHAHLDHRGGNLAVQRASRAPIYVHSADLPLAQSVEAEVAFSTAPLRALDCSSEALESRAQDIRRTAGEAAGADVVLSDGEIVDLGAGIRLRVVHSPGHTPGCASYYWETEGVLLTGDAVNGTGPRPGSLPLYFDAPSYRRTLVALAGLDARLLCTSHAFGGGEAVNHPTRTGSDVQAFLKESLEAADQIHRVVAETVRRRPDASKREIALAALGELLYDLPQRLVRETGMPRSGPPTMLAHINAAQAGSYPV